MKPILIPIIEPFYRTGQETEWRRYSRLFNPIHIVSIEPRPEREHPLPNDPGGYLYTVDGRQHLIPKDAYHEAFVAVQDAFTPNPARRED